MSNLRMRLLAAVAGKRRGQDTQNANLRCDGDTQFNPLANSGVASSPAVTPQLSKNINTVTPLHSDFGDQPSFSDPDSAKGLYSRIVAALSGRCPDFIEDQRWRQAIADGDHFLVQWCGQAAALGWTARDLFGLADIPESPGPNYQRLARYDQTGLIWMLQGRRVVALTQDTAVIETANGTIAYRRYNKPALGLLGNSLDDFARGLEAVTADNSEVTR